MQVWRRDFLRLAAGAAVLPINSRLSSAQSYPTRPVQIIVGFPAGSGPDIVARLAGQWLGERLGQQFVVDNRPGAGSNLGTEAAARATPDGYTMLLTVATNTVNATLYENLKFDFLRDIAPVTCMAGTAYVMAVTPSLPAKTGSEFIASAKANPGTINMASSGVGSASHVTGELFKMMAGVDMIHVPYRSNYLPDLLSGQVQVTFAPTPSVIGYIKQDQLRALGVTSTGRQDLLPDVPAVAEFVPGYEAIGWYGFGVPSGTPNEIINTLTKTINATVAEPAAKAKLAGLGLDPMTMSTPEFDKFVRAETKKWAQVIKFAKITVN
ncbi:MAG: tripartite tricarboxylate transporter substrate binding protein [Xanthobacteraceae bacterium]|nr:tripartite tricarboxylate transporter substrate binding protein [Xanthobacteraceae bacterium]